MDPVSALSTLKDGVVTVLRELKALEAINQLNLTHIPIYHKAISMLDISIERLLKIYNYKIPVPDHVALKMVLVEIMQLQMLQFHVFLQRYNEWCNNRERRNVVVKCCTLMCQPPSTIHQELDAMFQLVVNSIKDLIQLEGSILGSAARIKHPLLQKAWLKAGQNDLNASELNNNLIQDALFVMLRAEIPVKNKTLSRELIQSFVDELDGTLGSEKNGKLSMDELNECANDADTVAKLVGYTADTEDTQEIECNVTWLREKVAKITWQSPQEAQPFPNSYGSDFANERVVRITVPAGGGDEGGKKLMGVKLQMRATDQEFGGTKHAQIRYSITRFGENSPVSDQAVRPIVAFSIDRNERDSNFVQEITLSPNVVGMNDTIDIWLYCPRWNGWQCKLLECKAIAVMSS